MEALSGWALSHLPGPSEWQEEAARPTGLPDEFSSQCIGSPVQWKGPLRATNFASTHHSFHLNTLLSCLLQVLHQQTPTTGLPASTALRPICTSMVLSSPSQLGRPWRQLGLFRSSGPCPEPALTSTLSWMGGEQRGSVSYLVGGKGGEGWEISCFGFSFLIPLGLWGVG